MRGCFVTDGNFEESTVRDVLMSDIEQVNVYSTKASKKKTAVAFSLVK